MAKISVPENELTAFDLPPVCIATGETDNVVFKPVKFQWHPQWVYLFILAPLLYVIIGFATMKIVRGALPYTEAAWAAQRKRQILVGVGIVSFIVMFMFTCVLTGQHHEIAALILGIFALAALFVPLVVARNKSPQVVLVANGVATIKIPSDAAAATIQAHLNGKRVGA